MIHTRNCPGCNKELIYNLYKSYRYALLHDTHCLSCALTKNNKRQRLYSLKFLLEEDITSFYWLGLLLADGYISDSGVQVCFQKKDKILLDRFAKLTDNPNIHVKGNSLRICVNNKPEVEQIKLLYNINNNKTLYPPNFSFYENYSSDKLYALLFGLIDGDGYIYVNKKVNQISITVHDSWRIFYINLLTRLGICFSQSTHRGLCVIKISRKAEILNLYNKLLELKINYLERKWDKLNRL